MATSLCGDFNARVGSLPDVRDSELQVRPREHVFTDKSVNSHCKAVRFSINK